MTYLSKLLQFIFGVVLGIALLTVGALATARYLIEQFTTPPSKPTFAEEQPKPPQKPQASSASESVATASPVPQPTPSPTPSPTPKPGYDAKVSWPEGLTVRAEPDANAAAVGGIDYNTPVKVIGHSPDGNWEQISWGQQEGWVKAGNLEKAEN